MKFKLIAEIVETKPFRPFVVTTTTGDAYTVPHREHIFLPPSKTEILLYDEDMHFRIVDVRHVISVEPRRDSKTSRK